MESPQADDWAAALDDRSDAADNESAVLERLSEASWLEQSEWLDDGSDVSASAVSFAAAAALLTYTDSHNCHNLNKLPYNISKLQVSK